jgi:type II secretory ATPase GspE/PulE/Tfp pilus assembly ATPase PilB-like protein
MTDRSKLGKILIESQMITTDDVEKAMAEQKRTGLRIGEALIKLGIVNDEDIGWSLGQQLNLPFIRLAGANVDAEAASLVPEPLARRHHLVPFLKIEDELTVVMEDPTNKRAIAELAAVSACRINIGVGLPHEIQNKINEIYETDSNTGNDLAELETNLFTPEELEKIGQDFTGLTFLQTLIEYAVKKRVSSIHFEPRDRITAIHFRNGGGKKLVASISEGWYLVVCKRLRASLENAETRENLVEGFVSFEVDGQRRPYYTSIVATKFGSTINLLNLIPFGFPEQFDELPLGEEEKEAVLRIAGGRSGLLLVVGTTKTEKLAFLRLVLEKKHAQNKKTFTVGSMPWFADPWYMQLRVRTENREEMLEGIKVALTQQPDLLFVEDLWDRKVLQFALQSAITNLYIASTLHFPDTLTALEYVNESVENKTLLTKALRGIVGIHVFRTLCPSCRAKDESHARQSRALKIPRTQIESLEIFEAKGCDECNGSGYLGQTFLIEALEISADLSELLKAGHKFSIIREKLISGGHRTLEQQAKDLVLNGLISINDFMNVERR